MDVDEGFEERFQRWLRESVRVEGRRRIVRVSGSVVLVSKFEEGFAGRLLDAVDEVAEIFDGARVGAAYAEVVAEAGAGARVETWRRAVVRLLAEAERAGRLTADQRAEVQAGTDSVAALLDAVLWTTPGVDAEYTPGASERAAYAEALARMDATNSLFTRFYGQFEGRRVENHCPGAAVARRLLAQAWEMCTGPGLRGEC